MSVLIQASLASSLSATVLSTPGLAFAGGGAISFATNNHTGDMTIDSSTSTSNIGGSWYPQYPQISCFDDPPIKVPSSTLK